MGLFDKFKTVPRMRIDTDSEPHLFHSTDFGTALYLKHLKRGTKITIGPRIPVACMFTLKWLLLDEEKVGYLFNSQFQIENKGGYLLTYLNKGAGTADAVEVLVKTENLIIYSFPNHGALAVSPQVGEEVQNVFNFQ